MEDKRQSRHVDTLCVSVMTLATAIMAGVFVFLRFPQLGATASGQLQGSSAVVLIGVFVAVVIYAGCVAVGMLAVGNENVDLKSFLLKWLRGSVVVLVISAAFVVGFGILSHVDLEINIKRSSGEQP